MHDVYHKCFAMFYREHDVLFASLESKKPRRKKFGVMSQGDPFQNDAFTTFILTRLVSDIN